MDKVSHPKVAETINTLKRVTQLGIMHNNRFIQFHNINYNDDGVLTYMDGINTITVSKKIIEIKGILTARWLNHLYFRDGLEIIFV
jgi:hypothetical protein